MCESFLSEVYFKHSNYVLFEEDNDDVVEKMIQSFIELSDIFGPSFVRGRMDEMNKLL